MANAPIGTATAEPKSPNAFKAGPSKSTVQREAGAGEQPSKSTFADALKAAESSHDGTLKTKKADKATGALVSKEKSLVPEMKMKFVGKGKKTDFIKANLSTANLTKKEGAKVIPLADEGSVVSATLSNNHETVKKTDDSESRKAIVAVQAEDREGRHEPASQSIAGAAPVHRENAVEDDRRQKKERIEHTDTEKKSMVSADRTSKSRTEPTMFGNQNNRTSSARRVEVVDERNPEHGSVSADSTRKTSTRKVGSVESAEVRGDKIDFSSSDPHGEIAETDIELSPRLGDRPTTRSAATDLARKLDAQAGNEIVRQVKVVLNRSNAGEVRINLRPDNLGRVRVRIRMEDNKLTGRIFVESAAAREAFKSALDGLQAKLVESGFGAADLELAWDDSYQGFEQQGRDSNGHGPNSGAVAREFENMVPTTVVDETADGRVNMVV